MSAVERQFTSSAGRWAKFEELCGIVTASLGEVSQRVAASENYSAEEKLERLAQMKQCAYEIAQIDAEAKARSTACNEVVRQLTMESNQHPIEDFMHLFTQGAAEAEEVRNRASLKQAQAVKDVEKLMERVSGGPSDDIEESITPATQQLRRCPILNSALDNPVKNSCGHVYSLKGAIVLLYQSNHLRGTLPESLRRLPHGISATCPVAGCTSALQPGTLKRDFATELTQRQLQSASARGDAMDAEAVELL